MTKPKKKRKNSVCSSKCEGTPASKEGKKNRLKDKDSSLLPGKTGFQEEPPIPGNRSKSGCKIFDECLNTDNKLVMQDANSEGNIDWSVTFQSLLQMPADMIVLKLREGISTRFLGKDDGTPDQFAMFIKVASLASKSCLRKENLRFLFHEIFSQSSGKLIDIVLQMRAHKDLCKTFFMDLVTIVEKFMVTVPSLALKILSELVDCCIVMLGTLDKTDGSSHWKTLSRKFAQVQEEIHKKNLSWLHNKLSLNLNESAIDETGENFRKLSTMPNGDDVLGVVKPLVRKNITKGKFRNGEQFLDIHFRLLREDFLFPLRTGVQKYITKISGRNRDIRIYMGVKIMKSRFKQGELMYDIQMNLPKDFNVENTKRLMFGNMLCFSCDNFQNILCASITDSRRDSLRRGQLSVKFENDVSLLNSDDSFVVVETRSYFEAYKHTLAALKEMDGIMIPFYKHIVNVESQVKPPEYLSPETVYDLSCVKGKRCCSHLKAVTVRGNKWPSPEELGLDESQHRALHSALTRELAIIQGPPGTGKTFVGLKIAQVLLTNRHWQKQRKSPILCVCYTNHALDQFLEGMLSFTKRLIRVGSRSKSEKLESYQISRVCRYKKSRFESIYHGKREDVRRYESRLNACHSGLKICTDLKGIVSLDVLSEIIPWHMKAQLGNNLSDWLLNGFDFSLQMQDLHLNSSHLDRVESPQPSMEENIETDPWESSHTEEEREIWMEDEQYEVPKEEPVVTYETCEETFQRSFQDMETVVQNNPSDADAFWSLVDTRNKLRVLRLGLQVKAIDSSLEITENVNIWELDFVTRWSLYHYWIRKLYAKIMAMKKQYEIILQSQNSKLKELNDARYLETMREAEVIGMTLTGAAKFRHLLQALAPTIVIVEEAAEILEAHVIAAVSPSCQHLIMIGDHQQLRPKTSVFELATKYGLDVSLFERMINNNVQYETLSSQHRMRPMISQLLVPSIYPSLRDHSSVHHYPDVMGLEKNVFFVTHQYLERTSADEDSHANQFEGEFIMALCHHLMLQGYSPNSVTVLTPYTGQLFLLRKIQRDYPKCDRVRICIVDGFQGEESDIILLSLVRSNREGNAGFLRIDNRVCVALSRAKHGFYIVGNMNMLRTSSSLWKTIEEKLNLAESIGESLPLKCVNHPYNILKVKTANDFFIESPRGGCRKICLASLPICGHPCQESCHLKDMDHKNIVCKMKCDRVCERNHPCPDRCWMKCACKILVEKELPCGHVHPVPCSVRVSEFHCPTVVERVLPYCKHIQQMDCSGSPDMALCKIPCNTRLACGHYCTLTCHLARDPNHEKYKCREPCKRQPRHCILDHKCPRRCYEECGMCEVEVRKTLLCGHEAVLPCHLPEGCFVCETPRDAVLPCGHEQVIKCFQVEMDVMCTTLCTKSLPCGHQQKTLCHLLEKKTKCTEPCMKTHPCGHRCQRKCSEPCSSCQVRVKKIIDSCGHQVDIECSVSATRKDCKSRCETQLACGHQCQNKCSEPCTTDCKEDVARTCVRGHLFLLSCYISSSASDEEAGAYCKEPCNAQLECRHTCTGNCSSCFHGQVHIPCTQKCQRQLLCGHRCIGDCSSTCSPCQEEITFRCPHFGGKVPCGSQRKACNKPCTWKCKHHKCKNKCSTVCSCPVCEEPCPKVLPCKHPCIGFCGDPCPTLCRFCNRGELNVKSKNIEKARFVLLEDCSHVIEVGRLENWLNKGREYVVVATCPHCKHPIHNNRRYMDIVSSCYEETRSLRKKYMSATLEKKEVVTVVDKVYKNGLFREHLMEIIKANNVLSYKRYEMQKEINTYHTILFQVNLLLKACTVYNAVTSSKLCLDYLKRLISHAVKQTNISRQYIQEVSCELQRLCYLAFYHNSFQNYSEMSHEIEDILHCNLRLERFDPEKEDRLEKFMNCTASGRFSFCLDPGFRFGSWLYCPERHPYCTEYRQPYGKDRKKGCNVKISKVVPECQHKVYLECSVQPTKKKCEAKCILKLECGHYCQARCCDECTSHCSERVVHPQSCPRGHGVVLLCSTSKTVNEETLWKYCENICGEILPCGHSCGGQCGQCYSNGYHSLCREPCTRELVCGHWCRDRCSEPCGRCRMRCEKRCRHSQCTNICGAKCDPCVHPCSWSCKHHQCKKLCREMCSRPPCVEPCPKKLKCGHYCIGFCGEPCPKLCRTCNKDKVLEILGLCSLDYQDFPSEECQKLSLELERGLDSTSREQQNSAVESIDIARFVLLEDCGHSVEANNLKCQLEYGMRNFQMPRCPVCQQRIFNNLRYQRLIAWYSSSSAGASDFLSTGAFPKAWGHGRSQPYYQRYYYGY